MAKQYRLRHPDHEQRTDDGIYITEDQVEAMSLQTRGYELLEGDVPTAPAAANAAAKSGTGSKSSGSGGSSGNSGDSGSSGS